MTRATTTLGQTVCQCGYVVRANADRLRCPECKAWVVLDHSIEARQRKITVRAEHVSQWPAWARFIKRLARPTEAGVGDTVQRIAADFGGELFKKFAQRVGMPCGCTERQADWNRRYPYHGGDDGGSLEGGEASP